MVGLLLSLAAVGVLVVAGMTIGQDQSADACNGGPCGHGYVSIFVVLVAIPSATLLAAMGASTSRAGLSRAAVVGRGRLSALIGLVLSSVLLALALGLVAFLIVVLIR